jgi:hypothetical protein
LAEALLKIGEILAIFHTFGNIPCSKELFIIVVKYLDMLLAEL